VPGERTGAAFAVVDKLEREGRPKSLARLESEVGLERASAEAVLELFEHPTLDAVRERFGDHVAVAEAVGRLEECLDSLRAMGLADFVEVDLTIVRGLAYYTGIVFELFDRQRSLRAICGGGRYDNLLERVGGESLPAVGFGMGDVVLGELLIERGLRPEFEASIDHFLITVSPAQRALALGLAHGLRSAGRSVAYSLREQSVRKQFSAAGAMGAREVILLGPEEVARGVAVRRNMGSGEEREVALEELGREGA
jgi:histidyl-tRNA synthetase